jgi:hypothetical protein
MPNPHVPNAIRIDGERAYMALTTSKGALRAEAILDSQDVHFVKSLGIRWRYEITDGYVLGSKRIDGRQITTFRLHRVLLGLDSPERQGDHINGNGLDNRRVNLRVATRLQNNQHRPRLNRNNTSGIRGVYFETCLGKWRAQCEILIAGRRRTIHIGSFESKKTAAAAVVAARKRLMPFSLEAEYA